MTSIITAYYEIKSKFPKEQYYNWISNMFELSCNIILFTDKQNSDSLKQLRKNNKPLYIIEKSFDELEAWTKYKDKWEEHFNKDPENFRHSPKLYAIWAQKSFFVEEAININPFNSHYFMWCDIGAFRDKSHIKYFNDFPKFTQFIPQNKIVFTSVSPLNHTDKYLHKDGIIGDFLRLDRIVGGLWIGDKNACIRWKQEYENMLNKYFFVNRFAGKDQSVMLSTILSNNDLGIVIKPHNDFGFNRWFFLEYLLSGKAYYKLDYTYPTSNKTINLLNIPVYFICPDHNDKYTQRKNHMFNLLKSNGFNNINHFKSGNENYPLCLSKALLTIINKHINNEPILILEDDIKINNNLSINNNLGNTNLFNIDIPSFTDAFYLGISKSAGSTTINSHDGPSKFDAFSNDIVRVINMLSGHAILFCSEKYKRAICSVLTSLCQTAFHTDVAMSRIQRLFNVFAFKNPIFYQCADFGNTQHVQNETLFTITDSMINYQ